MVVIIPLCLLLLSALVLYSTLMIWGQAVKKRNRRTPLTQNLLRSPGEAIRGELEEIDTEVDFFILIVVFCPLLVYGFHVSHSYFSSSPESVARIAGSSTAGLMFLGYSVYKIVTLINRRRRFQLGLEGELSTAMELNQLMLNGCRVYHDIPTDYGNIDHVVVSKSGVFAVETKMIGKLRDGGSAKAIVDYPNECVKLSGSNWRLPVNQLETNARWLSTYLRNATGGDVPVESVLSLPGYFIEKRIGRGPLVINPKNPLKFFVQQKSINTPERIQQIAHQVEQLCRNVEPSFKYQNKRK